MSDNIKGLYVVFEKDMKDEHCENIINAILMLKNVIKVEKYITDFKDYSNREYIKCELRQKIWDILT